MREGGGRSSGPLQLLQSSLLQNKVILDIVIHGLTLRKLSLTFRSEMNMFNLSIHAVMGSCYESVVCVMKLPYTLACDKTIVHTSV